MIFVLDIDGSTALNARRHNNWVVTSVNGRLCIEFENLFTGERSYAFSRAWLCRGELELICLYDILTCSLVIEQKTVLIEEGAEHVPTHTFSSGEVAGWKPVNDRSHLKTIAMGTEDGIAITPFGMAKYLLPPLLSVEKCGKQWQLTDDSFQAIQHLVPPDLINVDNRRITGETP